jgi:hypothetical protein
MKGKHFYSNLIEIHDIYLSLSELDLSDMQRNHLMTLVEANIHATVINTTLSQLPEEDKKIFLKNMVANDHDKIWQHLKEKVSDIEEKINESLKGLKKELLKDIEESKKS